MDWLTGDIQPIFLTITAANMTDVIDQNFFEVFFCEMSNNFVVLSYLCLLFLPHKIAIWTFLTYCGDAVQLCKILQEMCPARVNAFFHYVPHHCIVCAQHWYPALVKEDIASIRAKIFQGFQSYFRIETIAFQATMTKHLCEAVGALLSRYILWRVNTFVVRSIWLWRPVTEVIHPGLEISSMCNM